MRKHAYLIIAHNNLAILEILLNLLDYNKNDIFIHLDKKSQINIEDIKLKNKKSNIYIYKELNIKWGDFSQIQTELFLLKKARETDKYQYYHLISGVDMPLKTQEEIHNFFDKHDGKEFIHFYCKEPQQSIKNRVEYRHIFVKFKSFKKNKFLQMMDTICVKIQKLVRIKYNIKNIQYGANWFSITNELVEYVLEKKKWIKKMFKYSCCGDEVFLQTVVNNSKFKDRLYHRGYDNDYHACMRLIDWTRGAPYIYKTDDYNLLINSDFLWARKFDENVDFQIVKKIYNSLICKNRNIEEKYE